MAKTKSKRKWVSGLSFKILEKKQQDSGLSIADFCAQLGVSPGGWRLWKQGLVPMAKKQEKILAALNGKKPTKRKKTKTKTRKKTKTKKSAGLNARATALEFLKAGQLDELVAAATALQGSLDEWVAKA